MGFVPVNDTDLTVRPLQAVRRIYNKATLYVIEIENQV